MDVNRRGKKVVVSLNERRDICLVPLIARPLGWLARQRMNLCFAWKRDLATNPVEVTMPAERVPELFESIADRAADIGSLMLDGFDLEGYRKELGTLIDAGAAIAQNTKAPNTSA